MNGGRLGRGYTGRGRGAVSVHRHSKRDPSTALCGGPALPDRNAKSPPNFARDDRGGFGSESKPAVPAGAHVEKPGWVSADLISKRDPSTPQAGILLRRMNTKCSPPAPVGMAGGVGVADGGLRSLRARAKGLGSEDPSYIWNDRVGYCARERLRSVRECAQRARHAAPVRIFRTR